MNSFVLLKILGVLIAAFSQILLKKSANINYSNKMKEYLNVFVLIGYGLFFVSSIIGVISLRGITISLSSIIESLSYIIVPVLSFLFLKEELNLLKSVGMIIIILGIIIYNI